MCALSYNENMLFSTSKYKKLAPDQLFFHSSLTTHYFLQSRVSDDDGDIVGEKLQGDSQQNDAEELTKHIDHLVAQPALEFFEESDDDIVDDDIQQEADEDVHRSIFGAEREEGGDGSGTSDEGEGHGNDGGSRAGTLVLDELASHHHLQGQKEKHEGTGDGEGVDVNAEEVEDGFAGEEEDQEEAEGHAGGLQRLDMLATVFHADKNGDGARDIDDGVHHDEDADNLDKIDVTKEFYHTFLEV